MLTQITDRIPNFAHSGPGNKTLQMQLINKTCGPFMITKKKKKKKTGLLEETVEPKTGLEDGAGKMQGDPETSCAMECPVSKNHPKQKNQTHSKGFTLSRSGTF